MAYRGFRRSCRNPHRGLRIDTSGRALNGSHRSCFTDRKQYEGLPFSKRQELIIAGAATDTPVKKQEVVIIMKKAESLGRHDVAEKVYELYGSIFREIHSGDPSPEEAAQILEELTPKNLQ